MMWLRWGRIKSSAAASSSSSSSPSAATNPAFSFSFRDLRSIANDGDEHDRRPPSSSSALTRSAAVFHRVRAASASLRLWRSFPSAAAAAEEKRIVVYYTSLGVVRKTFEDCRAVRSIFRGFRVAIDERDLSMDSGFLAEFREILGKKRLALPRVFIGGRYVGGFDEIQQLHESGDLKKLIAGVPEATPGVCDVCGGVRFVLCQRCSGSHKYFSEKGGLRTCNACSENGLVRCPGC